MKENKYIVETSGKIGEWGKHGGSHYFDNAKDVLQVFYDFMSLPCNDHLTIRRNDNKKSLVCEWSDDCGLFWYYAHDGYKEFRKEIGYDLAAEQKALEKRREYIRKVEEEE